MDIRKTLVPKKTGGGNTTINYGFSSTVNNNSSNTNINTDNLEVVNLNSSYITASQLVANNIESNTINVNNLNATSINTGSIDGVTGTFNYLYSDVVNGNNGNFNNLNVTGTTTTHGNVIHKSDYVNSEPSKYVDMRDVWTYLGSFNTFKDLIGEEDSTITSSYVTAEYLEVTKRAHFFELVIDKVKAAGGTIVLSPADGFDVEIVEEDNSYYCLYWRACSEVATGNIGQTLAETQQVLTEKVSKNMWEENDQALCQEFNAVDNFEDEQQHIYYDVSNQYWWRVVEHVSTSPVIKLLNDQKYYFHWIQVVKSEPGLVDDNSMEPKVGDSVAMVGNRTDGERQGVIVISCYTNWIDNRDPEHPNIEAPFFAEYSGVNNFNLASHRRNWIAKNNTTLQGTIKLQNSDGKTVEDYVDEKVADIESGDQFFTNLLVFENQNINVPSSYNGAVTPGEYGTYLWTYHGNTALNIIGATSLNTSYLRFYGGTGTANPNRLYAYVDSTGIVSLMQTDKVTEPIRVTAVNPNATGTTTIEYNGSIFFNKIKYGKMGEDGKTPVVYDVTSDYATRSLTYNSSGNAIISPTGINVYIKETDVSKATNKITTCRSVPTGMSLWYRYYNHDNANYSNATNITTNYNNGYYINAGTTYKRSIYLYLVVGATSPVSHPQYIYDSQSVPLMVDGMNGHDGATGINGVSVGMKLDKSKSVIKIDGHSDMALQGKLLYRNGTEFDDSYNWQGYSIKPTTDNVYYNNQTGPYEGRMPEDILLGTINVNVDGTFNKTWSPFSYIWQDYYSEYRPTTIYADVYDRYNNKVLTHVMPIVYEAGASLEVTDSIMGTVQDMTGNIAQLQATATAIQADVRNNSDDIARLQITASGINTRVQTIERNYATTGWVGTYTYSAIQQSASSITASVNDTLTSYYMTASGIQANYYTKTQTNSQLKIAATGIFTTVSETYETKTGAQTSYNQLSSEITQTANSISLSVNEKTKTGENLFYNAAFADASTVAKTTTLAEKTWIWHSSTDDSVRWRGIKDFMYNEVDFNLNVGGTSSSTNKRGIYQFIDVSGIDNVYFCISLYVKTTNYTITTGNPRFGIDLFAQESLDWTAINPIPISNAKKYFVKADGTEYVDNVTAGGDPSRLFAEISPSGNYWQDTGWHKYYLVFKKDSVFKYLKVGIYGYSTAQTNVDFYISQPKIEVGTVPTVFSTNSYNELKNTGINIEQGKITLNAENTIITGNLTGDDNSAILLQNLRNEPTENLFLHTGEIKSSLGINFSNIRSAQVSDTSQKTEYSDDIFTIGSFPANSVLTLEELKLDSLVNINTCSSIVQYSINRGTTWNTISVNGSITLSNASTVIVRQRFTYTPSSTGAIFIGGYGAFAIVTDVQNIGQISPRGYVHTDYITYDSGQEKWIHNYDTTSSTHPISRTSFDGLKWRAIRNNTDSGIEPIAETFPFGMTINFDDEKILQHYEAKYYRSDQSKWIDPKAMNCSVGSIQQVSSYIGQTGLSTANLFDFTDEDVICLNSGCKFLYIDADQFTGSIYGKISHVGRRWTILGRNTELKICGKDGTQPSVRIYQSNVANPMTELTIGRHMIELICINRSSYYIDFIVGFYS